MTDQRPVRRPPTETREHNIYGDTYGPHAPELFTALGGDMLDAMYDETIRLCSLAGAARGDRIMASASGALDIKTAALDYLKAIDAVHEITPPGVAPQQRIFVLA